MLDLGSVRNIAEVFVNGERCGGILWKPPFRADATVTGPVGFAETISTCTFSFDAAEPPP